MKSTTAIAALAAVAALAISAPARADIFSITIDGSRLNEQGTELPFEATYVFDSGICRRGFAPGLLAMLGLGGWKWKRRKHVA
jgi:hypothetical protein